MAKIYSIFILMLLSLAGSAQCPVIRGAMANSCSSGAGEGINEYVFFTTTQAGTAADYILYYGSSATPKGNGPTGVLSGADATNKTSTGTITATGGCSVIQVTSPGTNIPANSSVLFIPSNFDQTYDVTGICISGSVYVVYIGINDITSIWGANGTLANSPSGNRYIQVTKGSSQCTAGIRKFANGWAVSTDGNAISWNEAGDATYFNAGCSTIVTPVKLFSFNVTGKGNNANLVWKTASELNASFFDIERSTNGNDFKPVGKVTAAGNSSQVSAYSHNDLNIPVGTNYYRLKMVDRDGSFSYSPIVKISNSRNRFEISNLYPTPARNVVNIAWSAPSGGTTHVAVFDITGRLMIQKEVTSYTGMNNAGIDITSLPAAQYMLRMEKDGLAKTISFTKQ